VTGSRPLGITLVLHGGQAASTAPAGPFQLAALRMIPLAAAISSAVSPYALEVRRPLFSVRGWNGALASPVGDLTRMLDEIKARSPGLPVLLVGHSMGARAALRAAGHPAVIAVAGLAPWLPPGEPADQLAGRRVLLAHGTADRITSPHDTWAYAERAGGAASLTAVAVAGGDHPMLRRAGLWHALAAQFARVSFGLPADPVPAAAALTATAARATLITLS
jgi:pimeloyl-ACP methyl ester carboxylesterase